MPASDLGGRPREGARVSHRRYPMRNALVAAIMSATLVVGVVGTPAGADWRGIPDAEVVPLGTFAVGRLQETFIDRTRPTDPTGTYEGASDRTLVTTIFYPARGTYVENEIVDGARPARKRGPYPLVLFSHGVTANATVYEGVIGKWVSAGYVVAAPDYPLSKTDAPGGSVYTSGIADVTNQPADASFVIDEVIALSKERGPLRKMVARTRIGASGHSLGGITTLGLVFADCCIDDRVDAAIPMSGIAGLVDDGEKYFEDVDTPLLLLHGDRDDVVSYQGSVDAFARASAPKFLLTFSGAGHVYPFVGAEGEQGAALVAGSLAFWDAYLKRDRDALDDLRAAGSEPGVATLQELAG